EIRETYSDMLKKSFQYANYMASVGIKRGNRIIIFMNNSPEVYHIITAAIAMGVVYAPAATVLTEDDIRYRISTLNPVAIFVDKISEKKVQGMGVRVINVDSPDVSSAISNEKEEVTYSNSDLREDHVVFFTSGTEGKPKMVVHSNSYPAGHKTTVKWLNLEKNDIHWNISSPGWAKWAWSSYYSPFIAGATVFNLYYERFSASDALDALQNFHVTSLCAPPTVWRMFLLERFSGRKLELKKASSAGEPLNPEIIKRWKNLTGVKIKDGYGQSESTLIVGNTDVDKIKEGSVGKPIRPYRIAILDGDGKILESGKTGYIALDIRRRPGGLFKGYMNDEKLNSERFKNGYYLTGDQGYMDKDGYLWFVSRADDVIKSSDYRIGPFEVESILLMHTAVAESAVVGTPDPIRGDLVKAYVILKEGYRPSYELAAELSNYVRRNAPAYMRPKEIEFVRDLPKTISGKIIRKQLRKIEIENFERINRNEKPFSLGEKFRIDN
ncbi:MAG: AMP-binding protein, partial [Thermoplasmata archaeon]